MEYLNINFIVGGKGKGNIEISQVSSDSILKNTGNPLNYNFSIFVKDNGFLDIEKIEKASRKAIDEIWDWIDSFEAKTCILLDMSEITWCGDEIDSECQKTCYGEYDLKNMFILNYKLQKVIERTLKKYKLT